VARTAADIFSLPGTVAMFVEFEVALAAAQAECGVVPPEAAAAIALHAPHVAIDLDALQAATERTGYPVAPFVRQLTAACGDAGHWLHWGATTQDLLISTRARQVNEALGGIAAAVHSLTQRLAVLADTHRGTVMAGRGFGGHALPITFGLKCAHWLAPFVRHAQRLSALRSRPVDGEFGGAMGTLASLGDTGLEVQARLMRRLGLPVPLASASSARDAMCEALGLLALVCATAAKTAQDVAALTWTEIAELAEPTSGGKDTSSALPHKANPIFSWQAVTAAQQVRQAADAMLEAMRQEQERSGHGFIEARVVPEAFIAAERCLERLQRVLDGLQVDAGRMRRNLDLTGGLVVAEQVQMALAGPLGRLQAHDLMHAACQQAVRERRPLAEVLAADPVVACHLDRARIDALLDPAGYLGATPALIDRVLTAARALPAPALAPAPAPAA
jgi:3-carboxy-cis,cis-muconate cycloisomerase